MHTVFRRFMMPLFYTLTGLVIVTVAVTLVVVNLTTLPKAAHSVERYVKQRYGITLTIGQASYLPFRGVILNDINFLSETPVHIGAHMARIRVRFPLKAISAARGSPQIPTPTSGSIINTIVSFFDSAAQIGLLPNELIIEDTSVSNLIIQDRSLSTTITFISVLHDRQSAELILTIGGIEKTDGNALISINYASGALTGTIETDGYPIKTSIMPRGNLSGRLRCYSTFSNRYVIDGNLKLTDMELSLPALSEEPVDDVHLHYDFSAYFDPEAATPSAFLDNPHSKNGANGALVFTRGKLSVNKIQADITPAFRGLLSESQAIPRFAQVAFTISDTPIQLIIDSIPSALSGSLSQTRVHGSVSYQLNLDIPTDSITDLSWRAEAEERGFAVTAIHSASNPFKLNDEFVHTIIDDSIAFRRTVQIPGARPASMAWMLEHSEHTYNQITKIREANNAKSLARPPVSVIPDSLHKSQPADPTYTYVYLDDMSPWIIRSILTAEDGDFFFYGGINWVTLIGAIERNIEAGEILYGASTISMQLAKLLFLDQQRVFSRKLQEVFLVYLMEHHVPVSKDRILELYINLAEFGPGIFGIYDAAWYYFKKPPHSLTVGEATWLATIMPSPKNYHRHFENGYISDGWFERMKGLYEIMRKRDRMSDEEYNQAVQSPPEFAD